MCIVKPLVGFDRKLTRSNEFFFFWNLTFAAMKSGLQRDKSKSKETSQEGSGKIHVRNFGCGSGDREEETDEGYFVGRRFADGRHVGNEAKRGLSNDPLVLQLEKLGR